MKKLRRSARLVDMTQHLLAEPHKLIPLTVFAEQYGAAKSSISEDLSIIKEAFESQGVGVLTTVAGAAAWSQVHSQGQDGRCACLHEQFNRPLGQSGTSLARRILVHVRYIGRPRDHVENRQAVRFRFCGQERRAGHDRRDQGDSTRVCDGRLFECTGCHRPERQQGDRGFGCEHQLCIRFQQADTNHVAGSPRLA